MNELNIIAIVVTSLLAARASVLIYNSLRWWILTPILAKTDIEIYESMLETVKQEIRVGRSAPPVSRLGGTERVIEMGMSLILSTLCSIQLGSIFPIAVTIIGWFAFQEGHYAFGKWVQDDLVPVAKRQLEFEEGK